MITIRGSNNYSRNVVFRGSSVWIEFIPMVGSNEVRGLSRFSSIEVEAKYSGNILFTREFSPTNRFQLTPEETNMLGYGNNHLSIIAISPDGSRTLVARAILLPEG